jgi:caffeoyl-CoA O-methyltransferase
VRDFSGDFIHMKPLTLILALLVVSSGLTMTAARGPAVDPPTPGLNPKVQAVLDDIRKADSGQLAISAEDGRFLRLLVATNHTKQALEIGAASGYSAIWIGMGLRETGGRLVTIEYDPQRAKEAAANIARAGFSDIVRVVPGDAFKQIPKVEGQFDFVFLDAWKRDYQKFFDMVFPRMPKGGLFVAHNVLNKKSEMPDFLNTIETRPDLLSTIVAPSGEGVSVSWKRH